MREKQKKLKDRFFFWYSVGYPLKHPYHKSELVCEYDTTRTNTYVGKLINIIQLNKNYSAFMINK